jgi:two-component system sensor histidine kinase VicK
LTDPHGLINLILNDLNPIKKTFDFCCPFGEPSSILKPRIVFDRCHELVQRGVKVRCLTEITRGAAANCKRAAEFCEIRHIEGLKGFLGIADSQIFFSYINEANTAQLDHVKSTSKEFVQMQQYFYETLWSKAVPVSIRIKQLKEGIEPELTEIVTGWGGIIQRTVDGFSRAIRGVDHCCDSMIPPKMVVSPVNKAILDLFNRGGKTRMITEITKENLPSVKEMMKTQEIRHINAFKLNFGVSDSMFSAPTSVYSMSAEPQCIWSNSEELIRQHQYLFESLWSRAIPARQRFQEIEQGAKPEFVETLREPKEIQQLGFDLISRAEEEVELLFSTANASRLQAKRGVLKLLQDAALSRDVKVRILVPINDDKGMGITDETICQLKESGIDIRQIKKEGWLYILEKKLTLLLVDRSICLTTELEEHSGEPFEEAIGLATYSNSEPTVFAYSSIFENLWIQTEIMKRNSKTKKLKAREREPKEAS